MQTKLDFDVAWQEAKERTEAEGFAWGSSANFDPNLRQRAWSFLLYPDSMNPNTFSILSELGFVGAISPLHDSDHWGFDGPLKKPHFHGLVYAAGKTTMAALKPLRELIGGVRLQPVHNVVGYVRYFAHMDIDPELVKGDEGKVRYSPDDIIAFGGFDLNSYHTAPQTQVAQALKQLYALIREKDFTAYSVFVDYIYSEKPEFEFVMANPHVTSQVERYIKSRYAVAHKEEFASEEVCQMREEVAKMRDVYATQAHELQLRERQVKEMVDRFYQQAQEMTEAHSALYAYRNVIDMMFNGVDG